jgi:uncharacterized membrane protein HdeD (DUF308 family)
MPASLAAAHGAAATPTVERATPRRIAVVRAVLALAWAAALVLAVGDAVKGADADVPTGAAVLLAAYPLIDVVASLVEAARRGSATRVLHVNALLSAVAAAVVAWMAFGADAGATLAAFGAWAAVSGAVQFGVALHRRRTVGRQLPMLISGGVSTLAGVMFLATSTADDADVTRLAGYAAVGAVLYLVFALRGRRS